MRINFSAFLPSDFTLPLGAGAALNSFISDCRQDGTKGCLLPHLKATTEHHDYLTFAIAQSFPA
jgi:hypothetical protein